MAHGSASGSLAKVPSGVCGFDGISLGGLPQGRTTVILGAQGTGKTVFALQSLVNAAREEDTPGVFVAFEENTDSVVANAAGFGWDLRALEAEGRLRLLDAQLAPDVLKSGSFDLTALLATVRSHAEAIGARRVVFDAVDVLLSLLDDPAAERAEVYRVYEWLAGCGLTGLMTIRGPMPEAADHISLNRFSFVQYMAECVVLLHQGVRDHVALRTLRILKYRGSGFSANEYPMIIGDRGVELVGTSAVQRHYPVFEERISTGIDRLDAMLSGGYTRGTSIFVTGPPGTAKTTLGGSFTETACERGERALFLSLDEDPNEIVRNQRSVGIDLKPHVDSGLLRIEDARAHTRNAYEHLAALKVSVAEHNPTCMVVDPLSALVRSGGDFTAVGASVELIQFAKSRGITLLCTSLTVPGPQVREEAEVRVSTIADTWIQLSFAVQGGERNRALTIIKSRGTGHSNQVRELVLSDEGVTLADVYSAGGEVLMGTLRLEKEMAERLEQERLRSEVEARRNELELTETQIKNQMEALKQELQSKRSELELLQMQAELRERHWAEVHKRVQEQRRADAGKPNERES